MFGLGWGLCFSSVLLLSFQLFSLEVFAIGAVAKAVATTVTYPLQTAQSLLRVSRHGR